MANRIDPKKQFSKKLARWTSIFWFLFMTWLSILFLLSPETAVYCVYMGIITTVVMTINVWAYTRNSIYEKACLAMLDKTKIELGLGAGAKSFSKDDGQGNEEQDDIPEEESNG